MHQEDNSDDELNQVEGEMTQNKGDAKLSLTVEKFAFQLHEQNLGQNWKKWVREFETCAKASGVKNEEQKANLLLHFAGGEVQEIYAELPSKEEEADEEKSGPLPEAYVLKRSPYQKVLDKLNDFFLPQQNATYERHVLRSMEPEDGENTAMYAMRLKVQAERCNFGNKLEDHVKDQIIEKCKTPALRRELLKKGDANLQKVLATAKLFESIAKQEKAFTKKQLAPTPIVEPMTEVNKINVQHKNMKRKHPNDESIECFRCGTIGHRANDPNCRAIGKTCNKCGGRNHFSAKCKSKRLTQMKFTKHNGKENETEISNRVAKGEFGNQKRFKPNEEDVKFVHNADQDDDNEYVFCIGAAAAENTIKCKIGQVEVTAIIDSGSKHNLLDYETWNKLKADKIVVTNQRKGSDKVFKAYGGQVLTVVGVFEANVTVANKEVKADFYVMQEKGGILVGRDTAIKLGILKIGCEVNNIGTEKKVNAIGKIKDVLIDIPLRDDVTPVIQPYRAIAVPLERKVEEKINELLEEDIIERVEGPSKWVSPMVAIPKDDGKDLRICIDMRRANAAVQRENYPLPTIENFLPYIGAGKLFGKIDIKTAFHQVK